MYCNKKKRPHDGIDEVWALILNAVVFLRITHALKPLVHAEEIYGSEEFSFKFKFNHLEYWFNGSKTRTQANIQLTRNNV